VVPAKKRGPVKTFHVIADDGVHRFEGIVNAENTDAAAEWFTDHCERAYPHQWGGHTIELSFSEMPQQFRDIALNWPWP
jgi:hypothetical protein